MENKERTVLEVPVQEQLNESKKSIINTNFLITDRFIKIQYE